MENIKNLKVREVAKFLIEMQRIKRFDMFSKKYFDIDKWPTKVRYSEQHRWLIIHMGNRDLRSPADTKNIIDIWMRAYLTPDFDLDKKTLKVEVFRGE